MNPNKNKCNTKGLKGKQKPFNLQNTTQIAQKIMILLIQNTQAQIETIQRNQYLGRCLKMIAFNEQKTYFQTYFNPFIHEQPFKNQLSDDAMPKVTSIDSLAYACLDKVNVKIAKSTLNQSRSSFIQMQNSQIVKSNSKQQSIKLPLETIQQLGMITQLRKKKVNDQIQSKIQLQRQESLKNKKSTVKNIENVCFDYNGKTIQQQVYSKDNMISKILAEKLKNQKIIKKAPSIPPSETVEPIKKGKYLKKDRSKVYAEQFTQFLDTQSLAQSIEINRGIRYNHNALVFSQRKSIISADDLKSRLGTRKISKSQFGIIREYNKSKQKVKYKKMRTEQFKESQFNNQRSHSEANLNSRFRSRDTINVINPQLRESMLIRLESFQPFLVIQKVFPDDLNLLYEKKDTEYRDQQSEFSKNQYETVSKMAESIRMTPKLPPINRKGSVIGSNNGQLIISKLQRQLQNKLLL